jgi:PDZ domain
MRNAGRLTSRACIAILATAGAASFIAFAIPSTVALAGDSAAAETLAADALYERVGDSTTTEGEAAPAPATPPSSAAAPADGAAAAPPSTPAAPSAPAAPVEAAAPAAPAAAAPPTSPTAAAVLPVAAASPSPSPADSTSETVEVPDSMPGGSFATQNPVTQSTTEIPAEGRQSPPGPDSPADESLGDDSEIVNYQKWQTDPGFDPHLHSLQEFLNQGPNSSPLGIEVEQSEAKLAAGGKADGLLIVDVTADSPAAKAGLHPYRRTVSDILKGVSIAGALFFPPAVILLPVMDQVHIGETSDLIIAVDGSRVTDYLQFADRLRDVRPGEIVYLSIVRDGSRLQVPVKLPATLPPPVF